MDTSQAAVDAAFDRVVNHRCSAALVSAFFEEQGPFAGTTFDLLEPNDPNRIDPADLLAITFLYVVVPPLGVREILGRDAEDLERLLREVPVGVDLWEASVDHLSAAEAAWTKLREYDGVKDVISGKLLARKRPQLIPIIDSRVTEAIPAPEGHYWQAFQSSLQNADRRQRVEALRPEALSAQIPLLRLLDVAIWMHHSRGRSARQARATAGCD